MRQLADSETFNSNGGYNEESGRELAVFIDLGTGTAVLQLSTPNGWKTETTFTENGTHGFALKIHEKYRIVITGDSVAYLV
jgi:hypothetical protein